MLKMTTTTITVRLGLLRLLLWLAELIHLAVMKLLPPLIGSKCCWYECLLYLNNGDGTPQLLDMQNEEAMKVATAPERCEG